MTVTSCGPEGNAPATKNEGRTLQLTQQAVSSCPGKPTPPATYPTGTESGPAPGTDVHETGVPTVHESPYHPSEYPSAPPTSSVDAVTPPAESYPPPSPPAEHSSAPPSPPAAYSSEHSGPATSVAPYPTSVVTVITSKGPVGTGTVVPPPSGNAT